MTLALSLQVAHPLGSLGTGTGERAPCCFGNYSVWRSCIHSSVVYPWSHPYTVSDYGVGDSLVFQHKVVLWPGKQARSSPLDQLSVKKRAGFLTPKEEKSEGCSTHSLRGTLVRLSPSCSCYSHLPDTPTHPPTEPSLTQTPTYHFLTHPHPLWLTFLLLHYLFWDHPPNKAVHLNSCLERALWNPHKERYNELAR